MTATDTGALRELLARATPGPMRECGHDRGGCVCGLVFSLSEEIPVADFGLSGDEELRHARPGGEHRKANAALYAAAISVLPSMLAELDAARNQLIYAEAALAGETAQREHYSAYGITHNGMLLYCSSGMRDAYSELRVELDAARARIAELEKDAGKLVRTANHVAEWLTRYSDQGQYRRINGPSAGEAFDAAQSLRDAIAAMADSTATEGR